MTKPIRGATSWEYKTLFNGCVTSVIDSLSGLFLQKTINRWDDSCIANFDREIHSAVRRIEESALSFEFKASGAAKNGLANLAPRTYEYNA